MNFINIPMTQEMEKDLKECKDALNIFGEVRECHGCSLNGGDQFGCMKIYLQHEKDGEIVADNIDHPEHYTNRAHECIDEMVGVFGKEAVIAFCKCNVWKYRYREGSKESPDEDRKKADWYIGKMLELQAELKGEVVTNFL